MNLLKETYKTLKKDKKILIPFIILAIFEGIALYLVFLAPQYPVSKLLAPPIRKFFGEKALHYPTNLLMIEQIFQYAMIALNYLPGIFLNAIVVSFVFKSINNNQLLFFKTLLKTIKRFFALTIIWIAAYYTSKYSSILMLNLAHKFEIHKLASFIAVNNILTRYYLPNILIILSLIINFLSQSLFVYSIPLIIIEDKNIFRAIFENFKYLFKLLIPTTLIFFSGAIIFIPVIILKMNTPHLMKNILMEAPIYVSSLEILTILFLNIFITITTTILYINKRPENEL